VARPCTALGLLAGSGMTAAPLICVGSVQQQALDVTTAVQVGC
jgi:hypothetical protein